jgi:hypothetical protein
MKTKPITPYQRLMDDFKDFANAVEFRKRKSMWTYPKNKLSESWPLNDLYERVSAADQIGYDVRLLATEGGLEVQYIEKNPKRPWNV